MSPPSIFETASAKELTQERRRRYFLILHRSKIFDKLQQTVSLGIFRAVAWHAVQYRFGMTAQHGQFEEQSRIEHHVRVLLVGKNPFILSSTYAGPAGDRFLSRITTVVVVADDAAYQAVVRRGYPVMVVQRMVVRADT